MHYFYDLLVNLDEMAWEFYEWDKNDSILSLKKIPFLRVSEKDFQTLCMYEGSLEKNFAKDFLQKTLIKGNSQNASMILVSSTNHCLVIEFNVDGHVLARSQLLVEDENNANEMAHSLKESIFPFIKNKKIVKRKDFRQAIAEKNLIKIELKTLLKTQNVTKCTYLYYEWFGILENDLEKMITYCLEELKKPYTLKIHKIASLIRLSYKECL